MTRLEMDEAMLNELAQDMAVRRISRAEWFAAKEPRDGRVEGGPLTLQLRTASPRRSGP